MGISVFLFAMSLGSQVFAGGLGSDPPTWCGDIVGPEVWGVVVVDCTKSVATLRVKRIVDCNVETVSGVDDNYQGNCPANAGDPINTVFSGETFFTTWEPGFTGQSAIIMKVKNFKIEATGAISYDAQFKFCTGTEQP